MKRHNVQAGDTFAHILFDIVRVHVNIYDKRELKLYCDHTKVKYGSRLPNVLIVGDELELPTKGEWQKIKRAAHGIS